jgi:hypothetical protein
MNPTLVFVVVAAALTFSSPAISGAPVVTFEVIATFDYPGATSTYALDVNDRNKAAGFFVNPSGAVRGFVRSGDHLSGPLINPREQDDYTEITGINNSGTICGYYLGASRNFDSFLYSGSTYTPIDIGVHSTTVSSLNDSGNSCGSIEVENPAFVVIDGATTTFTIPGANSIGALGMNNLNQCVGYYRIGLDYYGFIRNSDGTLTYPILAANRSSTFLYGISDQGWMSGIVNDDLGSHGVLFLSPNQSVTYDYPGATSTSFNGMNNRGVIAGNYVDASGTHGLLVRVRRATSADLTDAPE